MKKSAQNRIIIWSIVSALLIALLVFGIMCMPQLGGAPVNFFVGNSNLIHTNSEDFNTGNAEFDVDKVKTISIGWVSGDVEIKTGTGNKITIEEYSQNSTDDNNNAMAYRLYDNGLLEIYSSKKDSKLSLESILSSILSFSEKSKKLIVTIPENTEFSEISVDSTSANVNISNIKAKDFELATVSGKITSDQLQGSSISAETTSGKVDLAIEKFNDVSIDSVSGEINVSGYFKEFDASTTSGGINAQIYNSNISGIDISTVSGGVELLLPNDIKGFTAEYDSVSGSFNCDFSVQHYDDEFIYGSGSANIEISSISGNASIKSSD